MLFRPPSYPRKDCGFCKTLRIFLIFSILVLALASLAFDFGLLAGIQFTDLFASLVGLAFLIVISWRVWVEIIKPKQDAKRKAAKNP